MLASFAPARRRLILIVAAGLAVAVIAALAVVAVSLTGSKTKAAAQDQPGPVLLVPGYGGSTSALNQLAAALRAVGRDARVIPVPGSGTGDLRVQARSLAAAAATALRDTGKPSVDVVGYSAGGVVARLWIRDYGGAGRVRRVVTLGSPQHGTDVAALAGSTVGCPTACQQLEPDSELLNGLNAGDETPTGPEWVSIWSTGDEVVVPPDSAALNGAINLTLQGICSDSRVAHGSLPTDPLVTRLVLAELDQSALTAFTSGDCERLSS
ncbi:MAG: lipase, class 2 [Pseudonocardiales bacterium]|nr:lipase, class 2 [Pseudonocardiales bacterium]